MMQQSVEDKKEKNQTIFKTCLLSNIVYLVAHIAYLIFFLITKSYALVYINIASVSIYLSFFLLIKYKKYGLYARGSGVEILTYMIVATILCGFNTGFHLCIIGLCIIAFYSSYFAKKSTRVSHIPVIWSAMSCLIYIALFFICRYTEPYYKLADWAVYVLFVIHTLIVFAFVTGYLWAFTKYVVKLEDRIRKESRTDKLTMVPNRHALYNYLDALSNKHKYLLAILDIDDFKKVNDVYGHLCGDYILVQIARIASRNSLCDFVARYGGEEFIIISAIEKSVDRTIEKIDRIRSSIASNVFKFEGQEINVTITVGVSQFEDDMTVDSWIEAADAKLYEGKNSGKNKTVA